MFIGVAGGTPAGREKPDTGAFSRKSLLEMQVIVKSNNAGAAWNYSEQVGQYASIRSCAADVWTTSNNRGDR